MSKFNADDDIKLYEEWCEHNKNNLPISFAEYCYQQGIVEERERIIDALGDYGNQEMENCTDTPYANFLKDIIDKAIEIVRGGEND